MPELPEVETIRRHLAPRVDGQFLERLTISDPRWCEPAPPHDLHDATAGRAIERLGVEPLDPDFTPEALRELARGRTAPVKAFLLSQERIAGVGNIYADEALFRARIHPLRPAGTLRRPQLAALRDGVVASLQAGIDARGASIDDFRNPDGARGAFQNRFQVYGRAGEPCMRCGRPIVKLRAAGRGTYVCERCQPRPRARSGSHYAASSSSRTPS